MTLVTYVPAPGYPTNEQGTVNAGGGQAFDVGAALQAGGGQFTVDSSVNEVLVSVLDKYPGLVRSGTAPGPPVVTDTIGPVLAHSKGAATGDLLVRGTDGLFSPSQTLPVGQLPSSVVSSQSTSSPILFVDAYGAKGDGSTDDTTAIQNALNAASNIGSNTGAKCPLWLTPGKIYVVSGLQAVSWSEIWGYGAALKRNPTYVPSIFQNAAGLTQFGIRGVTFASGTGTEAWHWVFLSQGSYLNFEDCYASNYGQSIFYVSDSQQIRVERNRLVNVAQVSGGANAINIVDSSNGATSPTKYVWILGNYVTALNFPLDFGVSGTSNRTDPEVDAHVIGNTLIVPSNGNGTSCPIGLERSTSTANVSGFEFLGNHLYLLRDAASSDYAFQCTASPSNSDPMGLSGVTIAGGKIVNQTAHGAGLLLGASYSTVQGVEFDCAVNDIVLYAHGATGLGHNTIGPYVGHRGSGDSIVAAPGGTIDYTTTRLVPAL